MIAVASFTRSDYVLFTMDQAIGGCIRTAALMACTGRIC